MPYEKVNPVNEKEMFDTSEISPANIFDMKRKRYDGHNTICQKLREIFMMTDNEEIKLRCRTAMAMAKRMHERLKKYHEESIKGDLLNEKS